MDFINYKGGLTMAFKSDFKKNFKECASCKDYELDSCKGTDSDKYEGGYNCKEFTYKLATCIGCGCDDLHACKSTKLQRYGCYWFRVDRNAGIGVCSECGELVEKWDSGDRKMYKKMEKKHCRYRKRSFRVKKA